jgi:hypothetical protein
MVEARWQRNQKKISKRKRTLNKTGVSLPHGHAGSRLPGATSRVTAANVETKKQGKVHDEKAKRALRLYSFPSINSSHD